MNTQRPAAVTAREQPLSVVFKSTFLPTASDKNHDLKIVEQVYLNGLHCSASSLRHSILARPRGRGGMSGKVLRSATTIRPCVHFDVSPAGAPVSSSATDRNLAAVLQSDSPVGRPAKQKNLPVTLLYIPQCSGGCQLQPEWVGATQCFHSYTGTPELAHNRGERNQTRRAAA